MPVSELCRGITRLLLLTDRVKEAQRLQQALTSVGPCVLANLYQVTTPKETPGIVVCDVTLDSLESTEALRNALGRLRLDPATPVLCLLRDPSHLTEMQARMAGATNTLPYQTTTDQLRAQVHALLQGRASAAGPEKSARVDLETGVKSVQALLQSFLDQGLGASSISPAKLDNASGALLAAIEGAGIQRWLDIVWTHDDVTYQHCLMVAGLVAAFALELGLPPRAQNLLSQGALVHDIGKAQIPRELLNKPGKLTPAEMTLMHSHPARGHAMLAGQTGLDPCILDMARHHHEYLDGSGYPDRLKAPQISRMVRIVTICDIYAALTECRPYKKPTPPRTALAYLESLGGRLDGDLLKAFRNVVRHG